MEKRPEHLPKPEPAPTSFAAETSSQHTPIFTEPGVQPEPPRESLGEVEDTEAEISPEYTPTPIEPERELAEVETTHGLVSEFTEAEISPKQTRKPVRLHPEIVLERVPGYLSVKEAARIMGVSERSVYGYVEAGKLPGARIGNIIVVVADYVDAYERKAPGRIRTTTPSWHMPPSNNLQFLTTIIARIRPGQGDQLEHKLYEIRISKKHRLLGTAARYIARNEHDPDEIEIVLIWRSVIMPSVDERENALAAFYDELADIIDWGTILRKEGRVLMHA